MIRAAIRRLPCALLLVASAAVEAQMVDDSLMVPRHALLAGASYGHDRWSHYWEGALERENGNLGTVTTRTVTWMLNYGVSSRLNLIAALPRVSTRASAGTLQGQSGLQDLTLAAKYRVFGPAAAAAGDALSGFASASCGVPVSDYVPDLLPLSIGLASRRLSGRFTLNYRRAGGWFADATAAYTWRGQVTLDRPAYYTDGQLFLSDEVAMPDLFDYTARAGYMSGAWMVPLSYTQQVTRGGGDIRRQDMPFVSDRMNFSRLSAMAMYTLPRPGDLALRLEAAHTFDGRNVGKSTTLSAGLMYTFRFSHN